MRAMIYGMVLMLLTAVAQAAEQGVIRGLDNGNQYLTIDEMRYSLSPALHINNLGEGLNSIEYAIIGQPVRFTLDNTGRIDELWLYPPHAAERDKLGIRLGDERQ